MDKEQTNYNFNELEDSVLDFWERNKSFDKLVEKNKSGERYRFLDGPITANNGMGIHHAWGRTLKDIFIRYNAMKGKSCQYQNGFDAQGLWVEVEVEKELGFKDKQDIVKYGLENFTNACMNRVDKYSKIITEQSKKLGQWMDWEHSYFTNSDENITSIWHFLKVCYENGWLVQRHRVMPWCPRCGTSLSEHEMKDQYHDVECESIYFKLPLKNEHAKMLVWTTTPWTLPCNSALAVNNDLNYAFVRVKSDDDLIVVCEDLVKPVLKDDIKKIVKVVKGTDLVGLEYEAIFPQLTQQNFVHKIIPWEEVTNSDGTGIVHIAPGCGPGDYDLGLKYDLPQLSDIDELGVITNDYGIFAGKTVKTVAPVVFEELKKQNKFYKTMEITHPYEYCWRCKTDIVYRLVNGWYIKTDELKERLVKAANTVNWQPDYVGKRMIDWLNNMGDWNISRKRFYGLPLPFYVCEKCGKLHVIGSKEELIEKSSAEEVAKLPNLHRPWIDDIKIKCECGGLATRITDVGDCWLDAGITPFSTKKYFTDKKYFEQNFPNECVIEMVEQVRLWFYSLLFMSVVLEDKAPYERVLAYKSVVKEDGGKFSKSGYMIKFDEARDKIGADSIRYLYAGASVSNDVRFGYSLGDEARRKLLGFWNSYVFYNTYAVLDEPKLDGYEPNLNEMNVADKWLIERTNEFVKFANERYADYDTPSIVKYFETYVDDLSNWYIRINRRRFYKSKTNDQMDAYYTLYHAIKTTIQIMAPIIPFMTEHIWQKLVRTTEPNEAESVHLSEFPKFESNSYERLLDETQKVREVVYLAQKLRNDLKMKVKQPLSKMFLKCDADFEIAVKDMEQIVKDEINIKEIEFVTDDERFNFKKLVLNFKKAGAVLKQNVNNVKNLLLNATQPQMQKFVTEWEKGEVETEFGKLTSDLFELKLEPKPEFAVAKSGNTLVVLDIELTPELVNEGILREITREIQVARKDAEFDIEDRIVLNISSADKELNQLIEQNIEQIKSEVLAVDTQPISNGYSKEIVLDNKSIKFQIKRK